MMVRWTDRARRDLLQTGEYIARDNPAAARRWIERLRDKARSAARTPLAGRVVPELGRDNIRIARNVTMDEWGFLESRRYLIHDRDTKFTDSFRAIVRSSDVEPLKLPAQSPNLNAYAERWVKSVKDECRSKLILFGEASLRRVLREYLVHHHTERTISWQ